MVILLMPTESCNFRCTYCFEDDKVKRPKTALNLDIPAVERTLTKMLASDEFGNSSIGLHGGECLSVNKFDLEAMLKIQYSRKGTSSVQTNGWFIDDGMIRLFKKYNTYVGLSIDGDEQLNTLRGPNPENQEITLNYNKKMKKTIRKLIAADISVAIMVVLHTENVGDDEKVTRFEEWLLWLNDVGAKAGRLNPMFASHEHVKQYELTTERLIKVWNRLFDFNIEHGLRWNPFREMVDNLLGYSVAPCSFGQCDIHATTTQSILPDGSLGNCDKTFSEGILLRANIRSTARYHILEQTQCKGCKYLHICNGGCPCEGQDRDWRNKSQFCEAYQALYNHIEKKLRGLLPNIKLVTDGDFDGEAFKAMSWNYASKPTSYGGPRWLQQPQTRTQLRPGHGDTAHGDGHGDKPHGDKPHGDSDHGDMP